MEVYQSENHFIIVDGNHFLWCSRLDGSLKAETGNFYPPVNAVCIGIVHGVVGKVKAHTDSEWKLILIKNQSYVGHILETHNIYQINKVAVLSLSGLEPVELGLSPCPRHHGPNKEKQGSQISLSQASSKPLQKTWNSVKSAVENVKPKKKELKDKEKFEKRIYEELLKLFNESNSFYYSLTFDLTNSIQRQYVNDKPEDEPMWKRADERFFWNQYLLKELLESNDEVAAHWIVPIIQGFIQNELCLMEFDINKSLTPTGTVMFDATRFQKDPLKYWLTIISRRSRHRAGTRSKKRGLEESGACANYVETEQLLQFPPHLVSFVQVRGSVPVFWSQSGFKYRPPPRLEKDEQENRNAFLKHFEEQLNIYEKIAVITLVELTGKEQVIGNAYLDRILDFNSKDLIYITFDFHEYCRGMKFENISILTDCIKDIIRDMRYCWVDSKGSICEQKGVFRINCVDCLDRTNVVQTAIARIVMETQCRKLGLLPPDETLPQSCRVAFQLIWANNGDAISHQYAGTAALKGDFTRTGERKLSGLMKDGVNSANRYYLRFKDDYRQAAIDVLLGQPIAEETLLSAGLQEEDFEGELLEKEENVRTLIDDLKKMLIVEPEQCLGGWSLVNADPVVGDHDRQEMDIILLLSQRAFYVGWYDDEKEAVTQYQQVLLEDIVKIEIGLEPLLFKSKHVCMRIHYNDFAEEGFFHMFRVPSTRLFNNVVVSVKNEDDAKESLKAVSHCFLASQNIVRHHFEVVEKLKLERIKLKPHPGVIDIGKQLQETSLAAINLPRNVSESSLNETEEESGKQLPNQQQNHGFFQFHKHPLNTESNILKGDFANKIAIPLKGTSLQLPKLNLHNLNPIKNVNLKALRLPTVFYSNKETKSSMERLSIGAEHSLGVSDSGNSLKHLPLEGAGNLPQSSDMDVVSNKNLLDMSQDENTDVMFRSCGILATNPKQLLVTSLSLSSDVDPEELPQEISAAIDETRKPDAADQFTNLLSLGLHSSESEIENSRMALTNKTEQENFTSNFPDTHANSYPASICDDYDESSDNYDNFNCGDASTEFAENSRDKSNQRRRPLPLKPSFSDGAISSHPEINTYSDLQKPLLLLENNPFTKIGQKIQSSMSRSSSKATVDLLKEQVLEKLKDRECETQIIFI